LEETVTTRIKDLANVLRSVQEASSQDLAFLQGLWRARDPKVWSGDPEIFRRLGEKILKLGEPLLAYDVVAEGIGHFPANVQLRQLLSRALARSGALSSAHSVVFQLYQEGRRDEETIGLLASIQKDRASEASSAEDRNRCLQQAYEFYTEAYGLSGGYWTGINAATLALVLGNQEQARFLASELSTKCREKLKQGKSEGDRYWLLSTLGEAALLLGNWSEAEDWYAQALEEGAGHWGNWQSTRRNARLLLRYLDGDRGRIERLFEIPSIVVFTGHMVDVTTRETPRFPSQIEGLVRDELRRTLKELNAGFGYASAACGSDILFHEVILEMNGEAHVVLPYEKQLFIKDSVDIIPNSDWVTRFERVIARAVEVREASRQSRAGGQILYDFGNLMLHGLATVRAEQLDVSLTPMAVWDGMPGDGAGGTASIVERWRNLGLNVKIIDLQKFTPREKISVERRASNTRSVSALARPAESEFVPQIRALLFADAQGFSKLDDVQIPRFVQHFLGRVGEMTLESAHRPLTIETWGDALYFGFSGVRDAGHFALDLLDFVNSTDWQAKGLSPLNLRIGLHAGPVYSCTNPVTQRVNYVGPHVSWAARIEPITPAGQVYASEAFAALAAAEGVKDIRCDYVGQTPMAKGYGTFATYVVRRRRATI
jgi:class 3 adenylate cyclase/tetratricopeptide (TPR) repeat protein